MGSNKQNGKKAKAPEKSLSLAGKAKGAEAESGPKSSAQPPSAKAAGDPKDAAVKAMGAVVQRAQFAQMFSQAVGVLMRDPLHMNLPIRDLEFMLLPPLMAGQCVVGNAKSSSDGPLVPVALALWARVSPSVDKRLNDSVDRAVPLKANEWTSGSIVWLVTLAGSPRALSELVKQLCEKDLKGQTVKMVISDKSGKRSVHVLNPDSVKLPHT